MPADYKEPTNNKFEGLSAEHPGEKYALDPALEPNKFPRESYEDGNAVALSVEGDQS